MDFDDLNPPLAQSKGDAFFDCLTWILIIGGIAAFVMWLT